MSRAEQVHLLSSDRHCHRGPAVANAVADHLSAPRPGGCPSTADAVPDGFSRSNNSEQGCSRRQWLGQSAVGAGSGVAAALTASWGPSTFSRVVAAEAHARRAKSVILIFNCGAPSHIDLWDPKPLAPDNIRGEFSPIETNVPGILVSELLPRVAQRADKLAIIRSVSHGHGAHNSGMYWSIVGRPYPQDSTLINPGPTDHPSFGTLVGWLAQKHGYRSPLPPYVITPAPHCDSLVYLTPGQFGACLGSRFDPFVLNADPNAVGFTVPNLSRVEGFDADRLKRRLELWERLDRRSVGITEPQAADLTLNHAKAAALVGSDDVSRAFDLRQEPDSVRDRYGRHTWGQSHLLARRLVEAGVPFVTTVNGQSIVWDTHKDNFNSLKKRLVPPMETAYVALLDDLAERGLLDSTLVVWMGDFGRTPLINGDAGRDHWPGCYTMVLAGGGVRGGQVIGASDKIGGTPAARPLTPADLHATVFAALGYDAQRLTYQTADGRPQALSEGQVIRELLG